MHDYNQMTNEMLILLMQKNLSDEFIFMVLSQRFMPLFLKMAYTYRIENVDPEDIIQEGLCELYKNIVCYQHEDGNFFAPYFARSFANRLYNLCREQKTTKRGGDCEMVSTMDEDAKDNLMNHISPDANYSYRKQYNPEDQFFVKEALSRYGDELSSMEQIVVLRIMDGYSLEEIGKEIGKTEKQVKYARDRAKKKLIELLNGEK